jgi:hypothetical protein
MVTGLNRARIAWAYHAPHPCHIAVNIAGIAFGVNRSFLCPAPGAATIMPVVPSFAWILFRLPIRSIHSTAGNPCAHTRPQNLVCSRIIHPYTGWLCAPLYAPARLLTMRPRARSPTRDVIASEITTYTLITWTIAGRTHGCPSRICLRIRPTAHFAIPIHTRSKAYLTCSLEANGLNRGQMSLAYHAMAYRRSTDAPRWSNLTPKKLCQSPILRPLSAAITVLVVPLV